MWSAWHASRVALAVGLWLGCVGALDSQTSPDLALQEALALLQSGQVEEARSRFEAMVEEWPNFLVAHYHLGRLSFDRGELQRARRHLDKAASGSFPRVYLARFYLGKVRRLLRDFDGAIAAFDGALEQAPGFAPALAERGRARLFLGEFDAGLNDMLRSSEIGEPGTANLVLSIQLLIFLQRFDEAESRIEELASRPEIAPRWRRVAQWMRQTMRADRESRRGLSTEVGAYPEAGDLYWALGTAWQAVDSGRAAELYRTALDHDSENPLTFRALERVVSGDERVVLPEAMPRVIPAMRRASSLWQEGRFQGALRLAEELLSRRSRLVPMRLLLAREAERVDDLWQAVEIYLQLFDHLGPVPDIGRDLAEVAQTMGLQDLAVCGVEVALAGNSEDGSLLYLLGTIEADRGRTLEAVASFRRAAELGYRDVRLWLRLGELHFERMEISESLAAYREAMIVDPAAAEVVRSFALSSLTTDQYADLRQILEAQARAQPGNVNTLYSLGVMSLRDDRLDDALRYFLALAELAPDHRQVHYNLGQIYLRQGDRDRGRGEMEQFRQIKAAEDQQWEAHNQAHLRRLEARRLAEAGRPGEAIELYRQSIQEGTAELSDYLELAGANLAAGDVDEARHGYRGILSSHPYHRQAWEGLHQAATVMADEETAAEAERVLGLLTWPCKMLTID